MKHFVMAVTILSVGAMAAQAQVVNAKNQQVILQAPPVDTDSGGDSGGNYDGQAPDNATLSATADDEFTTTFQTLVPADNVGTTQMKIKWATVPLDASNIDTDGTDVVNADGSPIVLGSAGTPITIVSSQFQPGVPYFSWVMNADAMGNWNQGSGAVWSNPLTGEAGSGGNGGGSGNGGGGGGGMCSAGGSMSLCLAALASVLLLARK